MTIKFYATTREYTVNFEEEVIKKDGKPFFDLTWGKLSIETDEDYPKELFLVAEVRGFELNSNGTRDKRKKATSLVSCFAEGYDALVIRMAEVIGDEDAIRLAKAEAERSEQVKKDRQEELVKWATEDNA